MQDAEPYAGALGNSTKPAPLVGPGLAATEPAAQLQQSAAALAQQALAPVAPQEAASLPGITFAGIPAGAALPTSAVPLPGGVFAGATLQPEHAASQCHVKAGMSYCQQPVLLPLERHLASL